MSSTNNSGHDSCRSSDNQSYDSPTHVVVGGGTAGLFLTHQLLLGGHNVILIEQGNSTAEYEDDIEHTLNWSYAATATRHTSMSTSGLISPVNALHLVRDATLEGTSRSAKTLLYPQGSGLGGTSNLNAGIFTAGCPVIFDKYWKLSPTTDPENHDDDVPTDSQSSKINYESNNDNKEGIIDEEEAQWDAQSMHKSLQTVYNILKPNRQYAVNGPVSYMLSKPLTNTIQKSAIKRSVVGNSSTKSGIWASMCSTSHLALIESNTSTQHVAKRKLIHQYVLESIRLHRSGYGSSDSSDHDTINHDMQSIGKLTVICNAKVEYVDFEDLQKGDAYSAPKAVSVATTSSCKDTVIEEHHVQHKHYSPSSGGEIILCAGAIYTPKILVASGLQDQNLSYVRRKCNGKHDHDAQPMHSASRSRSKNDTLKSSLPNLNAIGQNLQDHLTLPILCFGPIAPDWGTYDGMSSANADTTTNAVSTPGHILRLCRVILYIIKCIFVLFAQIVCKILDYLIFGGRNVCTYDSLNGSSSKATRENLSQNGVHGWIFLDKHGKLILPDPSADQPTTTTTTTTTENDENILRKEDVSGPVPTTKSTKDPVVKLVFVDGRCAAGYLPHTLLPLYHIPSNSSETESNKYQINRIIMQIYMNYLRPFLAMILSYLSKLSFIQYILRYYVFGLVVCIMIPKSRGKLIFNTTAYTNAKNQCNKQINKDLLLDVPEVELCFLTDANNEDLTALQNGMQTARSILSHARIIHNLSHIEMLPGFLFDTNASNTDDNNNNSIIKPFSFRTYCELFLGTYFHLSGTCAMQVSRYCDSSRTSKNDNNTDSQRTTYNSSVVDRNLCVHGVKGLRIADTSIFPAIPCSPTQATAMAVGVALGNILINKVKIRK